MSKATHVFIAGGVSVNDRTHDKYPYNFLNPAVWRAVAYKDKVDPSQLLVLVYTPNYEVRGTSQKTEHPTVTGNKDKKADYFWNIVKTAAAKHKFQREEIRSADALTKVLKGLPLIGSVQYFGHASSTDMLLDYSVDGAGSVTERWTITQAKEVKPSQFTANALFMTFGCYQGDASGLAASVRKEWKIRTVGSISFTHYDTIGMNKPYPRSEQDDYMAYPAPLSDAATKAAVAAAVKAAGGADTAAGKAAAAKAAAEAAAPTSVNVTKDLHGVSDRFGLSAEELAALK